MLVKMRGSITGHETSLKFGDVVDVDQAHGEAWVSEGIAEAHDATASDAPIVWPRADAPLEPIAEPTTEPIAEPTTEPLAEAPKTEEPSGDAPNTDALAPVGAEPV